MNSEMTDLAREAVACDGWRWMPGMRAEWQGLCREYSAIVVGIEQGCPRMTNGHIRQDALPDLESPATLGCLLHLVREVWGDPEIHLDLLRNGIWEVRTGVSSGLAVVAAGGTEASALVAALKAGGDQ